MLQKIKLIQVRVEFELVGIQSGERIAGALDEKLIQAWTFNLGWLIS